MSLLSEHPHEPKPNLFESRPPSKRGSKKRARQPENPFHGVRQRSWGRYVSEIRVPGKKTRVWLGSFGSPEMAARAYDSAAFYLKGNSASLNFPDSVGSLPLPKSCSTRDIQLAAAKAARVENVGKRVGDDQDGSGGEPASSGWWGLDECGLATVSFDEVKEAPLLSPLRFEYGSGEEMPCSLMDDDEFLLSCF
ncbi:hypothetical protein K2173_008949 [Erythroxylum novogranatense]|uniref:AP2/ERF domain-containing protein n=1 Tax=Erythroxylum novogranatense TaxID=1862640 RepID=A0AAV8TS92_9ROSI|nr:hypothetical protein K2173_008949 [Erythroxylum novogranatense]